MEAMASGGKNMFTPPVIPYRGMKDGNPIPYPPIMLYLGRDDTVFSFEKYVAETLDHMPPIDVLDVVDGGHGPHYQYPERFMETYHDRFLQQLETFE